jgi:Reverse transcriptase (RNA-dependent DNA polymerase)
VTQINLDYFFSPDYTTMPLKFGTYVQVYNGTSNDTSSGTLGAIGTNPTGNSSGDFLIPLPNKEHPPSLSADFAAPLPTRKSGLRLSSKPDYTYRFGFSQIAHSIQQMPPVLTPDAPVLTPAIHKAITGLLFTQMFAAKGIKIHGQAAFNALRKEFKQFKAMDILEPLDCFTLSDQLKSEALRPINIIKEKRNGILKGRTCANGSTQRGKFPKEDTGSPIIAKDAFFLITLSDAKEHCNVATADIVGAYLHAKMHEFIYLCFTGWSVDLLCSVNPDYTPFAAYENKTKVLYVCANKAIYSCVVSGMLWYKLFSETLQQHGFTIHPYDFCGANAPIDGSQCTIVWYVDDTKISHASPSVVTRIISLLEQHFEKMTVTRGPKHEFLGMHIHYLGDGSVTIHMPSYIQDAIEFQRSLHHPVHTNSLCQLPSHY